VIHGKLKIDMDKILRELYESKDLERTEAECCFDYAHMFVRILLKYSVSEVIDYLKDKNSLMIFDRYTNLKYEYGNRYFWYCR
jgi:putative transposase